MKLFISLFSTTLGLTWIGLSTEQSRICASPSLDPAQKRLCDRNPQFAHALSHAAKTTVDSCVSSMSKKRWGCAALKTLPAVGRELTEATSESAYVHALGSANLVTSLYRLCESGTIGPCSRQRIGQFATEFTGVVSASRRHRAKATVEMHNSKVGRASAWRATRKVCKCHGQSGSCTQKTCWETAPDEKEVARELARKYETAALVRLTNGLPDEISEIVAKDRLLFLKKKSDFCRLTRGRKCSPEATGSDSCESLCCGRGFVFKSQKNIEENCQFLWPAKIVCEPVLKVVEKYVCQ